MQLRLTIVQDTEARTVIRVDGRLAGEGSDQLDEACAGRRQGLVLDLQNLMTIDDVGLATLRRFAGDGVVLRNTSPYVSLLLGKVV